MAVSIVSEISTAGASVLVHVFSASLNPNRSLAAAAMQMYSSL